MNAGSSALHRLDNEVFPVLAVLFCAGLGFAFGTAAVGSDSWLDLVAGRLVVHHGLPQHDTLTAWTLGRRWVDQQWLAQAGMYAVFALGGMRLLVLTALGATIACVAALVALARRRGAAAASVAVVTIPLFFLVLPAADVRAQTFAYPLLAALLWVLWGGEPSARRTALALPLLVVWANVHGSVLLGAALVSLLAADVAFTRRDPRWLAFVPLSAAAVFVSPYGFALGHYYRTVLFNPSFGKLVTEWRAPTLDHQTLFFVVAVVSIVLVAARRGRFALSELAAFALTAAAAFHAVRNIAWFALIALVLVPRTFDVASAARRLTRLNVALVAAGLVAVAGLAVSIAFRDVSPGYPASALDAVPPSGGIWADERYADWLLFERPSTQGRVLFDARFELLTARELSDIARFRVRGARTVVVRAACGRIVVSERTAARPGC